MNFRTFSVLTAVVITFFMLFSCSKVTESVQRDIVVMPDSIQFIIPEISNVDLADTTLATIPVQIDLDALIKSKAPNFGISNLQSIRLTSLAISLVNPDTLNNFQNIQTLTVSIEAPGKNGATLISVPNIPDSRISGLNLPITSQIIDLKELLTAPSVYYRLRGRARRTTAIALTAYAKFTYTITLTM